MTFKAPALIVTVTERVERLREAVTRVASPTPA